ncbi:MAG: hypothetical protein OHK93_008735 [Ramalina farinacea]|uniref:Uncharacterized protein n=1 Tax=Ramalina farinacea TaxID=258253 RepID=A0AA43QN04_9LECA|nr:hypothetical protein [Ramalina farinacea]
MSTGHASGLHKRVFPWQEPPERQTKYGAGPETKGGGYRSGPKRWTGSGPAPARHIPWPEIFRHHISLIEGHLKMIDMVRKHTVEGSGNWTMICGCIDRAKEMMSASKHVAKTFVPPPNQREKVPIGSSSASMYPGYSPADHEYGAAAEEYGTYASEAKKRGELIVPEGVEYQLGQSKGVKKNGTLEQIRAAKKLREGKDSGSGSGSGSGSDDASASKQAKGNTETDGNAMKKQKVSNGSENGSGNEQPVFVVDTQPMKVNMDGINASKRSATPPQSTGLKNHKKAKKSHDGALPAGHANEAFEDINAEVEEKLKEKREKKNKPKEAKKRKRESDAEDEMAEEPAMAVPQMDGATDEKPEKRKKKKSKHTTEDNEKDRSEKRAEVSAESAEDGEGKKKKKNKKKSKLGIENGEKEASKKRAGGDEEGAEAAEGKKKKRRKGTNGEA